MMLVGKGTSFILYIIKVEKLCCIDNCEKFVLLIHETTYGNIAQESLLKIFSNIHCL